MLFKILIFYRTDEALDRYLKRFRLGEELKDFQIKRSRNELFLSNGHIEIRCKRGLDDSVRGHRAHFIAIQEDLTWRDNWQDIYGCVKRCLISPIPVQIFDGIEPIETV